MIITVCVGSACYLKGAQNIVELMQKYVREFNLSDKVTLGGNFCLGECNRNGVTVKIDDVVHVGITPENFDAFFKKNILGCAKGE